MFNTIIVQPIFNLLVFIYAILPGHNFGLALIIFTIVVRMLLWPLVKKQLHQAKVMRQLQPELKRIKKATKGNRQQESLMTMALYKEKGVNPFGSIGILLLQLPILIGLYSGLHLIVQNPHNIVTHSYPFIRDLSWVQHLSQNIHAFDMTLFGFINLTRPALGPAGTYIPALLIVIGSAVVQFYQSKHLMPSDPEARKLRHILRSANDGKQADQAEVNAAVGRSTRFMLPAMVLLFTIHITSALSLYWLIGGLVAFIQQTIIFRRDEKEIKTELDSGDKPTKDVTSIAEGEVVSEKPKQTAVKKNASRKKRRKR
jgi:YidC/Oxa1 family membrane protein insertase